MYGAGTVNALTKKMDFRYLPAEVKQLIPHVQLPVSYTMIRNAMVNYERLDEVKRIADQATALATLAKEAGDESFFEFAARVRARAYQEIGDRLEKYRARSSEAPRSSLTQEQKEVAAAANISPHKAVNAILIAGMDSKIREQRIEGPKPPSVSRLALEARALLPRSDSPIATSQCFENIVRGPGGLIAMVNFIKRYPLPQNLANELTDIEAQWISSELMKPLREWIDQFATFVER